MKKKILFFAAALLGVCNAYAVVKWDGTSSTTWTEGEGTEASPYIISSPAHLKYLADQVNAGTSYADVYFKQTQDFNLDSKTLTSIGTSTNQFSGVYDGGSKYISNLKNSIFGYINNAEIKNLTLQGADITASSSLVANTNGICVITNCHNKINVSVSSISCGGLIYKAEGTKISLINCSNTGNCTVSTASKNSFAGGLIGITACETYITQCYNTGAISSLYVYDSYGTKRYSSGDFIGIANSAPSCLIEKSYSTGSSYHFFIGNASYGKDYTVRGCYSMGEHTYTIPQCYNVELDGAINTYCCYAAGTFNVSVSGCDHSVDLVWRAGTCYVKKGCKVVGNQIGETEMKSEWFVSQINAYDEYFTMDLEGINDGYPILKWQAGTRYTITATCDANRGTVTGGGEYPNGYTATLTATPKPGCTFVGWSDGETANPRYINVAGEATYTAQFTKSSYTIYINQDCTSNIE